MASRFLDTLSGKIHRPAPVWLMRQAGRYMAEYRALRSSEPDFISFCLNSDKAAEVTLQPIHRFGFDAAIIFSDILLVPWALKRNVRFVTGTGPLLDPLENVSDIDVSSLDALKTSLAPVGEAITKTRAALPVDTALIGFAGQRVIQDTIREQLPEGFQRAEYLQKHGMVDMVVPRRELKDKLAQVLDYMQPCAAA